jgi:hypothetical protein
MKIIDVPQSGKLGTFISFRNRFGQFRRKYVVPKDPHSPAQIGVRSRFGRVSARWRVLADEQRAAWNAASEKVSSRSRLGKSGRLTGCQRFVKINSNLAFIGQAQVVDPYHLVAYHGNWYLLALNTAAGRIETFALSRCRSVEGSGQHFARLVGFHAPAFFKDALGISQADNPWKVRLLFASEVATYIRERVWHARQELRQRRGGALELRLQTSSRKELTRWILSWMPHVQVLASRELRDRVRQRMRQGLARCG